MHIAAKFAMIRLALKRSEGVEMSWPYLVGFRPRKAAQVAAFFASQENPIEKLKLIKLIYLSERESLCRIRRTDDL